MSPALTVLHECLASQALRTADPTSSYLDQLIERELCAAAGLRVAAKDIVLAPPVFTDHVGRRHTDIKIPVRVKYNTERTSQATGKPVRGFVDVKLRRGVIEIATENAGEPVTVGGVEFVPRSSLYFTVYKSTLVHEMWHILTIVCGIPRFKSSVERNRIPGETPEAYQHRYRTSEGEVQSYTHQLTYVLTLRLEEKLARMAAHPRMSKSDIHEREVLLTGTPRELLTTALELKILPKKLAPWVETVYNEKTPESVRAILESEVLKMQSVLRAKYRDVVYYGA